MIEFKDFLLKNRKEKNIRLFFDIETLQYNEDEGRQKPSKYKNVSYAVAIGYYNDRQLNIKIYPSFKELFDTILTTYEKWKILPKIELIAHNNNKYDNHFLRHDLIYFYELPVKNLYLKNATKEGNLLTLKKKGLTAENKKGVILEKRIKSSNNLELNFYINNIEFYTTDNYMKTNTSIKTLGTKLFNLNLITEDDLKTDYNYTEFNKDYDMSNKEAYNHALQVFNNLNEEQLHYIENDITILAESVMNYSLIFKGFDYSKITYTSNILEFYNDNDLTSYQLTKSVGRGKEKMHVKYTSYSFGGANFYDYLKSFYSGGLNFYNDKLIGDILTDKTIALDINSSYPYVMHNYKVPTYLNKYEQYNEPTLITIDKECSDFYLFRMTKKDFDNQIIEKIESRIIKQMLVKYYSKKEYININSYTIKLVENITNVRINELKILSYVSFTCEYFASRDKIADMYEIKERGSSTNELIYNSPYDIQQTTNKNESLFTKEETDISKVILNGLYGIPALRSHFNIFRWFNDDLQNVINGYENNERNIVFSVFVTAVSLYNLLDPLKYLTANDIDNYFIYCDTDSLYFNKKIEHKLSKDLFHPNHLGKWSMEHDNIEKFIVINHKKYAYEYYNEKEKRNVIEIKCGGIPNNSFNTVMTFEKFVETQFHHNIEIKNKKSIYNEQGTISIYDSTTVLQIGKGYQVFSYDERIDGMRERMLKEIREQDNNETNDFIYIESNLGTYSESEINPHEHDKKNKEHLHYLKIYEREIINHIVL